MNDLYQKGFSRTLFIIVIIIFLLFGGTIVYFKYFVNQDIAVDNSNKNILIGFSITTLQEERWQRDKKEIMKTAHEMGVIVDFQTAQNNAEKQIAQIENMIVSGEDVIIVVPYKADSLTEVINKAHEAGIKVISYDRLIKNANSDLYISFNNEKVGEIQAQYVIDEVRAKLGSDKKIKVAYVGGSPDDNNSKLLKKGSYSVLQPLIDSGKVEVVYDKFTTDWNPDVAYENFVEYLVKNKADVDAVVAANDGTAFGVISALKEYKLDGVVPVSGQDAELAALQRIISGTQTLTVYKSISKLASNALSLAIDIAKGLPIETNILTNDGTYDIPSILLDPIAVTIDNIDSTIVQDGYHSREDIYNR